MDSAIKIQSTKRAQNEVKTDSIARLSDAKTAVSAAGVPPARIPTR